MTDNDNNLYVKGHFSVSSILLYNQVFEMILEKQLVEDIYFYINSGSHDPGSYNHNKFVNKYYYYDVMKFICVHPNIHLTTVCTDDYEDLEPREIFEYFKLNITITPSPHLVCETPHIKGNYITIHTNMLYNLVESDFKTLMNYLHSTLLMHNTFPIVLIGEKIIKESTDVHVHSMYEHLKVLDNVIDLTVQDCVDCNDIDDLKLSFNIIKYSKLNILISTSTISTILPFLTTKIIGVNTVFPNDVDIKLGSDDIEIYTDLLLFLNCLENRLKRINTIVEESCAWTCTCS
jgi:hypothetical protein